jgi:hypothetical protein
MKIIERIKKMFICIVMVPVLWVVLFCFAIFLICLPLVALINPEKINFGDKKNAQ